MKRRRAPATPTGRLLLYTLALFTEAALLSLAHWQYTRWQTKLALAEQLSHLSPVVLSGAWHTEETSALENQPKPDSKSENPPLGRRLFTPLETVQGTILVDRGWYPAPLGAAPDFTALNPTTDTVGGYWADFPVRHGWLRGPDTTTNQRLLAWLNPSLITSSTLAPQYLQATTITAPGLTAVPPPPLAPGRHAAYAVQWLAMAVVFPILCAVAALRRPGRRRKS